MTSHRWRARSGPTSRQPGSSRNASVRTRATSRPAAWSSDVIVATDATVTVYRDSIRLHRLADLAALGRGALRLLGRHNRDWQSELLDTVWQVPAEPSRHPRRQRRDDYLVKANGCNGLAY